MIVKSFNRPTPNDLVYKHSKRYYPPPWSWLLTNDSYFMGNLYHLIIYSSKCAYDYEKANCFSGFIVIIGVLSKCTRTFVNVYLLSLKDEIFNY